MRRKVEQAGLQQQVEVDSAGTAAWHIGKSPDPRSQQAALTRGYDLSALRARQAQASDFDQFDYVLAMDAENLRNLQALCPDNGRTEPKLFLAEYGNSPELEVPDPYYGGDAGFEHVLDLIENACDELLADIQQRL